MTYEDSHLEMDYEDRYTVPEEDYYLENEPDEDDYDPRLYVARSKWNGELLYCVEFHEEYPLPPLLVEALSAMQGVSVCCEHRLVEMQPQYAPRVASMMWMADQLTEYERDTWLGAWQGMRC